MNQTGASGKRRSRYRDRMAAQAMPHATATAFSAYSRDVFCILDRECNCLFLSENILATTGLSSAEGLGEGLRARIAEQDLSLLCDYLAMEDIRHSPVRLRIMDADNAWRWYEMQLVRMYRDEKTCENRYECLLHNVNELVNAQDNLEKALLEVDIANKSRMEFLANMNHELRTPLNAIIGFAQMIESGIYGDVGHPKYYDYISNIQSSGQNLLSKVNDLIEIANINSGDINLNEGEHDLIKITRNAIELYAHKAFMAHVELHDNLPDKQIFANVDRVRILQVMMNLISNAIKFNKNGGTVDVYCEKLKNGGVNIVIEDSGTGIEKKHLERIRSAFGQENSFFARSRDCVGLGLALSKEIVKLHQGRIEIESVQNKGTVIKIVMPSARITRQVPLAHSGRKLAAIS
ncbi:MAG TPA: PAS domain-containing sensor histidine kinase [Rickettsiales bacterium]|nr:PAS domain-containing sensor histidine kinase [Rickettsiales bacterium]